MFNRGVDMNQTAEIGHQVREAFNFTVDKFPLMGPDNAPTGVYGLFRSDKTGVESFVGKGSVSKKYVPHTTEDVIALVDAASEAFEGTATVRTSFNNGHHVGLQPSIEDRRQIYDNDSIFPRLVIKAEYDGKAFKASVGYWRDLCRNMSIMREVSGTTVRILHNANLRDNMDDLIDQFGELKESWNALADTAARLEQTNVSLVDFLDEVYGKPEKPSTRHVNRTRAVFQRAYSEIQRSGRTPMTDSFEVSGWIAWNSVTGYSEHQRSGQRRLSEFDRSLRAMDDPAVAKAERYVLSLIGA
jgi:hypothetical protein